MATKLTLDQKATLLKEGEFGTCELITAEIEKLSKQIETIQLNISNLSAKRNKLELIETLEKE